MQIIEIQFLTKKKAKVLFDSGSSLVLYTGEIKKLGWQENDHIQEEQYRKVRTETVEKRAKLYAMHLLQDQDRTEKELLDKLKRAEYDQQIAQSALDYVKKFGYVDDSRYAEHFVSRNKGVKSRQVIRQELKKRGVDAYIIEDVLDEHLDDRDEEYAVYRLLKKRRYQPDRDADEDSVKASKERDKQLRYLASKGFSYAKVKYVFEHWSDFD